MATPDIQNLFERFLQIYGGQGASTATARPELQTQTPRAAYPLPPEAYATDDGYKSTGGVLGSSPVLPSVAPARMQGFTPPGVSLRPLPGGSRFGFGRGFPMPGDPVVDIPDPHLERLVPEWIRSAWAAHSLVSRMLVDSLLERRNQESDVTAPSPKPVDRSGGLGWYVGPPQLEEELKRSTRPSDVRILKRIDDDDAADRDVASPPLAPENPANTEGCDKEWAEARRDCEKGMGGPPGQGPYSRPMGPRGRRYTVEDCMNNVVSARCGGTPRRDGLSGQEAAKRNNDAIQKKRKGGG